MWVPDGVESDVYRFILIDGETGKSDLRKGSQRAEQGQRDSCSQEMVLLEPLRAPETYSCSYAVNHHLYMKRTLFGRLMGPITKWFNIFEMRFQLDTMRQQGLVPPSSFRPLRIASSISTNTSEEASSSNTSPVKRINLLIKSPSLSLGPQGSQKRTFLQDRFRSPRILRPRAYQQRGRHPDFC
jgi:hypothetical protein